MAASGLHQLIANHQQILSETVYRSFEVPLLHELDGWRRKMEEEEVTYQQEVKERSKEIRKMEKEGLKLHRQRKRDVTKFRNHLVDLTTKLDSLTTLHGGHARTLLRDSQETSLRILEASSSLVRAEVDIFEGLARKGWTGGGLDDLLERGVDLFANEPEAGNSDNTKLFSILPPTSILADTNSEPTSRARPRHTRHDSLLVEGERYQSLAGAVSGHDATEDTRSIFSEPGNFNRSRGVRPFSPAAIVRKPLENQESEQNPDGPLEINKVKAASFIDPDHCNDPDHDSLYVEQDSLLVDQEPPKDPPPAQVQPGRGTQRRWSVTEEGLSE
jgi:hypothetical protein